MSGFIPAPTAQVLLDAWTADGSTGTKTFTPPTSGFRHLKLVISARGTVVAAAAVLNITFNGVITNYAGNNVTVSNATPSGFLGSTTAISPPNIPGASAPAGEFSAITLELLEYLSTAKRKKAIGMGHFKQNDIASGITTTLFGGTLATTDVIATITLALASGLFVAGSTVELYGIR